MRELTTATIEIDRPNETYQLVKAEGYVCYEKDNNYGADADGNRGTSTVIVEEVTDITAYDEDDDEVDLTENEQEMIAKRLTEKFFEG